MSEQRDSGRPDGRQSRWEEHNLERRRQILDAAVVVIEREPVGAEVHVRQIADEAGIGRSVIYRHFADRADLDRAVQAHVLAGLRDRLVPQVTLSGTAEEIILRIVGAYVDWAADHPALHRLSERELGGQGEASSLEVVVKEIADQIGEVITMAAAVFGLELSDDDRAALDPLVFGLVGLVFGAVRRWLWRRDRDPAPRALAALLAQSIWFAIDGHARARGLELDPDVPLEDLIARALTPVD
ncbi:TetR/AcrR family transcriptional regulator [Nocardioides terrisoli]|uniref:TetR/AcrR family transcriptional regulator n=1 Tax=Nocardioides terrisoli TaxID=3388267 RepID=UPI00287BBB64|nr:TetR/AcrR family transcriptional regulator [Nocardioides marmorisolisilvae]